MVRAVERAVTGQQGSAQEGVTGDGAELTATRVSNHSNQDHIVRQPHSLQTEPTYNHQDNVVGPSVIYIYIYISTTRYHSG